MDRSAHAWLPARRYAMVAGTVLAVLLGLFMLAEARGIGVLTDPSPWLAQGGPLAALVGVGLLVVDVALPVPSSLVMVAHGALFGVGVGALLSLVGSTAAALVGFAVGRRGGRLMDRFVPADERLWADRLLARWGMLAIIVTRPIPLLAETTAIMAGASPLGWKRAALAAVVGTLPGAVLYAFAGAAAAGSERGLLVFGAVLVVAAVFWLAGRWLEPRLIRAEYPGT